MESSAQKTSETEKDGGEREREGGSERNIKGKERKTLKSHATSLIKERYQPASLCISSSALNLPHEVVVLSVADAHQAQPRRLIDHSVHVSHTFQPHAGDFSSEDRKRHFF